MTEEEKVRYSRHLLLEEVGEAGQEKLLQAKVLVVGAGGLGSPVLLYLAAAGIGTLGIMDDDTISESNLQRQVLYDSLCLGAPKAETARRKLQALNPHCTVHIYDERLTATNAQQIIPAYDIVIDATDNLTARYVINDACVAAGKPFVYGSICEFEGQVSVFNYRGGPTYRDLYEYHAAYLTSASLWGSSGRCPASSVPSKLRKPSRSSSEAIPPCPENFSSSTCCTALSTPSACLSEHT